MRTFSGLLVLEDIFDDVPTDNPDIVNLASTLFNPNLSVVTADCGTTLGKYEAMNYELQGLVELATGQPLTKTRINYLLSLGKYEVYVRHSSTCIAKGGICKKCYESTFPGRTVSVSNKVRVAPEYLFNAELLEGKIGVTSYATSTDPTGYSKYYVFLDGKFLVEGVDYTFTNSVLELKVAPTKDLDIVIRFIVINRSPFLVWLATTYSGALLGMKPLVTNPLPVRSLLLTSMMDENRLQLIEDVVKSSKSIPEEYSRYSSSIKDPLEKALFMLSIYCIYSGTLD